MRPPSNFAYTAHSRRWWTSGVPSHARAVDLPHEVFPSYFLDTFGRPRQLSSPCECAQDNSTHLAQVLHLVNSEEIDGRLASDNGRAAALAADPHPLSARLEELYLTAFCRLPIAAERKKSLAFVKAHPEPRHAFEDLIWTFLNCREFQFNH